MASVKDTFYKIKSSILGVKTANIDSKLDQAVKDISKYRNNSGRKGYIDLVKTVISKAEINGGLTTGGNLFDQNVASPETFGEGGRLARYKIYDSIIEMISYCKRALSVLTDNILSPDDITKVSIEVKPKTFTEDETESESKVKEVKRIISKLKLEKNLSTIVNTTLKYGDFFCEIADSKTALTSRSILLEQKLYSEDKKIDYKSFKTQIKNPKTDKLEDVTINLNINYLPLLENDNEEIRYEASELKDNDLKLSSEKNNNIERLYLVFHEPSRVVKLQSDCFPLCFGYLVFPKITTLLAFSTTQDQAVNTICSNILKSLQDKIPSISDIDSTEKSDLRKIINYMVQQCDLNKPINIRFVPSDRMQHFKVEPSTKYYPYGESIFDSSKFTSKVLIALETALTVNRLSRSTEKRKIGVELGLPRDAKKLVEKLKEEFRKRKISLDTFGTVDTIPSMISTFEDIYIPQKDGKAFVDISSFNEGNVDIRGKVDELKMIRDQLVADLGVPPAIIGIEENSVVKNTLSEENVLFARTIIGHQKYFTEQLFSLIKKVVDIIDPMTGLTLEDNIIVSLPTPRSLQFEREARYMGELANLVEALARLGIDKEYSKKRYLPDLDWEEAEKYSIDKKIDKELGTGEKDEGVGGLGGGMSGF